MTWKIVTTKRFEEWFDQQSNVLQERMLASLVRLHFLGPGLPRPFADTIKGSHFTNMKELRVQFQGKPIRAFYIFDFQRNAILLCAGDKSKSKRFYETMVNVADKEFMDWLRLQEK
ncbi:MULTISPECIES: type II toxin-antitoxin system RelE/ParE family toxin [Buttiauxella]|uniref:type II toxin-antitoxin system RelE/ParE family toxin n=1 Tax=Buttiauxella TaxID=82976 RepID=UPI00155FCFBA|nr:MULTISPECIES: type II toxin-antitoxin system RelE/ParE family toxin [Buttiauxella]MCS3601240.1 hypothetical protein [Buttiauxella sp. BIGb0471]BCG08805.1 hypothetical protein BADSM9389_14640 [Buttiauxella agrestis]